MQIMIAGPKLSSIDFNEILTVFKEKIHRIHYEPWEFTIISTYM